MRIMAIDYGKRRIGLALCDPSETLALPLPMIDRKLTVRWREVLLRQIVEREVAEIVVGLPKNMDGSEGSASQDCRRFAEELKQQTSLSILLLDERLTTVAAHASLRESGIKQRNGREMVDSVAASLLLQMHLQRRHRKSG
jgi:putative Holliday junction resolvase